MCNEKDFKRKKEAMLKVSCVVHICHAALRILCILKGKYSEASRGEQF